MMDRRKFLALATIATAGTVLLKVQTGDGAMAQTSDGAVLVTEFGADQTGVKDSTAAIKMAIKQVRARGARKLVFPHGIYRMNSAPGGMFLEGLSDFEIDGGGSTILVGQDAACLDFNNCQNVRVHDLIIDYDPLPYAQGTVRSVNSDSFVLSMDPGFSVPPHARVLSFGSYDRGLHVPSHEFFEQFGSVTGLESMDNSCCRVLVSRKPTIPVGAVVVLRYHGRHNAVTLTNVHNAAFQRVSLYSSYLCGFQVSRSADLSFHDLHIGMPPGSNRLMSTNREGLHITNCRGKLNIEQSLLHGMGDDAINIHTPIYRTWTSSDGRSAVVTKRHESKSGADELLKSGDRIALLDPDHLYPVAPGAATEGEQLRPGWERRNIPRGALIVDEGMTPATRITNCQFPGNRARAILAHNDVQIRNCTFKNTTLAAILIAPDLANMEGPSTRHIVIDSNEFTACHSASRDPEGAVTVDVMHHYSRRGPMSSIHGEDVEITNNVFTDCFTAAISCRGTKDVVIRANQIGKTWVGGETQSPEAAIIVSQLADSTIVDNTSTASNGIVVTGCTRTKLSDNTGFSGSRDYSQCASELTS